MEAKIKEYEDEYNQVRALRHDLLFLNFPPISVRPNRLFGNSVDGGSYLAQCAASIIEVFIGMRLP